MLLALEKITNESSQVAGLAACMHIFASCVVMRMKLRMQPTLQLMVQAMRDAVRQAKRLRQQQRKDQQRCCNEAATTD
jgi:hypothetical protein